MGRTVGLLVLLFATGSIVCADAELRGTASDLTTHLSGLPQYTMLRADATLEAQADQGIVMLTVVTEEQHLEQALKANEALRAKVMEQLRASGIPGERMVGSSFSSTPRYGFLGKGPSSYQVENIIKVAVQNEAEFQGVAKVIDQNDEIHYRGIEFRLRDKEELKRKALALAFDNLAAEKKLYEEKLGVSLYVRNLTGGKVSEAVPYRGAMRYPMKISAGEGKGKGISYEGSGGTGVFGEFVFSATVEVKYEVDSK